MSNRLFQGIIHQMKDAIDRTIGVVDAAGTIVCCSDLGRIGENDFVDMKDILSTSEIKVSVLINKKNADKAMNVIHDKFNLAD